MKRIVQAGVSSKNATAQPEELVGSTKHAFKPSLPQEDSAGSLARQMLSDPDLEGEPLKLLRVSEAFWKVNSKALMGQNPHDFARNACKPAQVEVKGHKLNTQLRHKLVKGILAVGHERAACQKGGHRDPEKTPAHASHC